MLMDTLKEVKELIVNIDIELDIETLTSFSQKELEELQNIFTLSLQTNKKDTKANLGLAAIYYVKENYQKANIHSYITLLSEPNNKNALRIKFLSLFKLKKYREAQALICKLDENDELIKELSETIQKEVNALLHSETLMEMMLENKKGIFELNKKYEYVNMKLKLTHDKEKGMKVVTKKEIAKGEIICISKPMVVYEYPKNQPKFQVVPHNATKELFNKLRFLLSSKFNDINQLKEQFLSLYDGANQEYSIEERRNDVDFSDESEAEILADPVEQAQEDAGNDVTETPEVGITFTEPEGWQTDTATVKIQVEDTKNTGAFSIAKVEARLSENGGWSDITGNMEVSISSNCSVYVRVTDQNGNTYEQNRYIECFDKTKPTIIAAAKNGILIVQGVDAESGIAALYVNGNEFTELTNNTLNVRLQKADTSYEYFTLQAKDKAGNMSEIYKVGNPYYENPDAVKENTEVSGTEQNAASLPADGTASKPTSATATVTEHQTTNETATAPTEPENTGNETDTEADTGRVQGESSASGMTTGTVQDKGGKEFYTIKTKSDKVFYLIVDKDKTDENVYLLTEVGENDLLNFTDTNMVTLPQNQAIAESALPLETEKITETPEPEVTIIPEEKEEPEKKSNNSGTILLMLLVLAGVCGAYYYWKFMKGRNTSFDYEEDEDDDEEEDTIREDDEELEEYEMEGEVEDEESEE